MRRIFDLEDRESLNWYGYTILNNEDFIAQVQQLDKSKPKEFGKAAESVLYKYFATVPVPGMPGNYITLTSIKDMPKYNTKFDRELGDFLLDNISIGFAANIDTKFSTNPDWFPTMTRDSIETFTGIYVLFKGDLTSIAFVPAEYFRELEKQKLIKFSSTGELMGKAYTHLIENKLEIIKVNKDYF